MSDMQQDRLQTRATQTLGIRYPIVQGGLARIARGDLAAAVSNAGGLGQIAVAGLATPELLRSEIRKARAQTAAPFAVNFPLGRMQVEPLLELAIEEGVTTVSFTAGNPRPYIEKLAGTGTRVLVLVSGPDQAKKAEDAGADVVAIVGFEGGGHIGRSDLTTLATVPLVVKAVDIPVLASGGIADGRGLAAALALGADGVEIGTRFVAVREAYAHDNYKQALVRAKPSDTLVVKKSLGTPGRVLDTAWARKVLEAEKSGTGPDEVLEMVRGELNERGVVAGDIEGALLWAGQAIGMIDDIPTAAEFIQRVVVEARQAGVRLAAIL